MSDEVTNVNPRRIASEQYSLICDITWGTGIVMSYSLIVLTYENLGNIDIYQRISFMNIDLPQ